MLFFPLVNFSFVYQDRVRADLPQGAGVVAVHACGLATDRAIDVAIDLGFIPHTPETIQSPE